MKARHEFESEKEYKEYLRKYFAGLAMQGLIAKYTGQMVGAKGLIPQAVEYADELLKALES